MRHRPCLSLLAAVALLWACGDGDDKPANEDPAKAAAQSATVPTFARLPAASNLIIGIDVAAVIQSPLWDRLGPQMAANIGALAKIEAACGFDPLSKIQSLVIAGDMTSDDNAVLSIKGITRDDIATCKNGLGRAGEKLVIDQGGALTKYALGDTAMWVAWMAEDELLISPRAEMGPGESAADLAVGQKWLTDRATGVGGLDQNAVAMALLGAVDTDADVWFVALPNAELPMTVDERKAKGARGTLALAEGVALAVALEMESAEVATEVVTKAKTVLAMLEKHPRYGAFVKALEVTITPSDSAVKLAASFSAEELDAVSEQAKNLAPAIFGTGHVAKE